MSKQDPEAKSEGEVDEGWKSYGMEEEEEGKTVGGTTEEDFSDLEPQDIPEEALGKALNEKEVEIIQVAVQNVECSLKDLEEECSWSESVVQRTLSSEIPEWYENTFKKTGASTIAGGNVASVEDSLQKPITKDDVLKYVEENGKTHASDIHQDSEWQSINSARSRLNDLDKEGYLKCTEEQADSGQWKKFYTLSDTDTEAKEEQSEEESHDSPETGSQPSQNPLKEDPQVPVEGLQYVCEYELQIKEQNFLAEHIIEIIETGGSIEQIQCVCEYELRKENPNRVAKYVHKVINNED